MAKKIKKTNVMRVLEKYNISYQHYEYDDSDNMVDGLTVANMINKDSNMVFKTLVTIAKNHVNYVFVLPVNKELDLKKAAKSVKEKKVDMIPVKDIEKTTGYIKGGCSPVGMKKQFLTVFDESALTHDRIVFNGGKVGMQVKINPQEIQKILHCEFDDICL